MRRRKLSKKVLHEDSDSQRWMISYADFITLLFAFFVVMYALSVINEGKYKVIADSLGLAFLNIPPLAYSLEQNNLPNNLRTFQSIHSSDQSGDGAVLRDVYSSPKFFELTDQNSSVLQRLSEQGLLQYSDTDHWLEITLNANILFGVGSAELITKADEVLKPIAQMLSEFKSPVQIEGFTDSVPIQNPVYPSNWELSTARASSVVRKLIELQIPPERLIAVGYGSNYPVATNQTSVGREQNRRVVMLVAKNARINKLIQATYVEQSQTNTTESLRKHLLENKPTELEKYRLPDGRLRFTTLPERIPANAVKIEPSTTTNNLPEKTETPTSQLNQPVQE